MLRWYKCAEFCILKAGIALHGLGMDALVIALTATRTELWSRHGCSGERMLLEHERNHGLGIDVLVIALIATRTELWSRHGCSGEPMLVTRGLIRVLEVLPPYSAKCGVGRLNPEPLNP